LPTASVGSSQAPTAAVDKSLSASNTKIQTAPAEVNELLTRKLSPNPLVEIHQYPGADHAFARHGGKTYSKPEADRALSLSTSFFNTHLHT
jgi:dienelactone hydrolase